MNCELCSREEKLTKHHLIPQKLHTKKRFRRGSNKNDLMTRVAWICRPCHDQIHMLFTEVELGKSYSDIELLKANEQVKDWLSFIKKQPVGFRPKMTPKRKA